MKQIREKTTIGTVARVVLGLSLLAGCATTSAIAESLPAVPSDSVLSDGIGSAPAKIVAGYWQMWQGPKVAEITASAPEYNLLYAAFARSDGTSGAVAFEPVFSSGSELERDIAVSRGMGCKWLISIGGGGNHIYLDDEENAREMVRSLIVIIDRYSFDGIDFDIENGCGNWSVSAAKTVALRLKDHYGNSFIVSVAPRPYEDCYRELAISLGDALDLFGYQFYDFPEASDERFLSAYIERRIDEAVALGIPAAKILIGCITYGEYGAGHNTVAVYRSIFDRIKRRYSDIRGVFVWETSLDKKEGWSFAREMGREVRGLL